MNEDQIKEFEKITNTVHVPRPCPLNHEIFYFTRPIEEEKVECECCELISTFKSREFFGYDVNHCPKCGEKL